MQKHRKWQVFALSFLLVAGLGFSWAKTRQTVSAMLPVAQKTVILDPGHGGWDPGKTGTNGDNEKDINLEIALLVQQYLEQAGAVVILTRNTDESLSDHKREDLARRTQLIEEAAGDILISIHQNSYPSPKIAGAQTFYHTGDPQGQALAECIQSRLKSELDPVNHRQAKANLDYYILKNSELPAAIVECGFLSNEAEEAKLNDADYQNQVAWSIYLGILDYFQL